MSAQPGPVTLVPGAAIRVVRLFDTAGRYRVLTSVGSIADLTDAQADTSNAVDVR